MTPRSTLNVKVIGQRSRSAGHLRPHFTGLRVIFEVKSHVGQGQNSHRSRSKVNLEGQGQISRSPGQKYDFRSLFTVVQVIFKVVDQG